MCDIKEIMVKLINERKEEYRNWDNSIFSYLPHLPNDIKGEIGERYLAKLLEMIGYEVEWDNQTNRQWDVTLNGTIKLEVKTATLGVNNRFQHEKIEKDRDFDFLVLLDISYNDSIYLTVVPKDSIPFDKKSDKWTDTKRSTYLRPDGVYYKWDLSLRDVESREVKTLDDVKEAFKNVK